MRRRKKSRPFLPTTCSLISLIGGVAPWRSAVNRATERNTLALKPPASPRSDVSVTSVTRSGVRTSSSGCDSAPARSATSATASATAFAYGRAATIASWARRRRAADTSFIARVIFCVDLTDAIRTRISFSVGNQAPCTSGANSLPNSPSTDFMRVVSEFHASLLLSLPLVRISAHSSWWRASTNAYSSRS